MCVRVRPLVGLPQPTCADMGVDLGGGQALVAEKFLDAAEIGPAVEHVAGKAVAERVG